MPRSVPRILALSAALAAAGATLPSADAPPLGPQELADKILVVPDPGHPFRYNVGSGPYGPSTFGLLERRRAFVPGEKVSLSFRLPREARLTGAIELKVSFALQDLDGVMVQDAGATRVRAEGQEATGSFDWTVPAAKEGSYFLAARFSDPAGTLLKTRSEVVFVAPDYPRLLADAGAAIADAPSLPPLLREVSLPSTQMLVEDAQMRFADFGRAPRDWDHVERQLLAARDHGRRLAAGEDPWRDRTGVFVKAYRSEVDDTLQPYGLYVPRAYDRQKPWPLLVSLHGATSNHLLNRRRVFGLGNRPGESDYEAIRNEDVVFPEVGFIVLTPYGRGEVAGYNGLAEQDVLRAMADVKRAYNVDEDRVYLTGLSMGGGGTWHLGLRYPDLFAAIAPVCAVGDLSLLGFNRGLSPEARAVLDLTGPTAAAENALNQQVFIFHGDEDPVVVPEHSRRMAARYRELGWLGRTVHFFEQPGVNHFAWDFAYREASLFARLAGIKRNPRPGRVVYTTYSPRFNKAYWIRIDRIDGANRQARIEATQAEGVFLVGTRNLSAFSLLLDPVLTPPGRVVSVDVDGRAAWKGLPRSETLSFAKDRRGRWVEKPWTGPAQGPPDHAEANFLGGTLAQRDAHVYVYGTGGEDAANQASEKAARAAADWGPNVRARFRVLADSEVTPEIMDSRSLVLFGTASVNRLVERMAPSLPLRQNEMGTFAGSRRVGEGDAPFRLHHPNPLAPSRYVLIYGAASDEGFTRLLPPRQPFLSLPHSDYLVLGPDGKPALEGYFKDDWTIVAR